MLSFQHEWQGAGPDSKEMVALVSYRYWLAKGAPLGLALKGRGYPRLAKSS